MRTDYRAVIWEKQKQMDRACAEIIPCSYCFVVCLLVHISERRKTESTRKHHSPVRPGTNLHPPLAPAGKICYNA